jgi:PAS domain S-box-containing protein
MPTGHIDDAALVAVIANAIEDAVISTDNDGIITSWNRGAERIFGYTEAYAIGQPIGLIVPPAREAEELELRRRAAAGDAAREVGTVRTHRDGSAVAVSLFMTRIVGADGDIVGTLRIACDAGGRRATARAARRLAAIVESSDDAIVSKDLNGVVMSWNRAAERMFGYSAAEMVGESIRIIVPDDRQSEEDSVLALIRRGDKVDHYETLRRRKDGTLIPVSLTVSPIRTEEGVVVGASKIARDVSERKAADAERARLHAELQEASRLKDEFLATLSHELRTPLNAILGYARMMRTGILPADKQSRAVEIIERNASSLTQIVEDVLDVSRIISGKLRLEIESVDLSVVIRDAAATALPAAQAKGIQIDVEGDGSAGAISGDPERLRQVVWNLMSNAVKFTGRGGRVRASIARHDDCVELVVTDTGIGIPADFLPHVFERFRQADAGTNRERGGLGLGLGIARQLVEMHGGTIHAESAGKDQGSTFRVRLPLQAASGRIDPQADAARPAPNTPSAIVPNLHGVRVLAVDDDDDALGMVREILEATGADVATASSAAEALDLLEQNPADVMVADLGLPRMDGFELIARVRESAHRAVRSMPAAALTAYARSEDRIKALRCGFQVHLPKPIDPEALMLAVATLSKGDVPLL